MLARFDQRVIGAVNWLASMSAALAQPVAVPSILDSPFARCRLCLQEASLQQSHLLPKSAYRYLRMVGGRGNPNPTFLSATRLVQTSQQVKDYLLCAKCEDRFNNQGERWCL